MSTNMNLKKGCWKDTQKHLFSSNGWTIKGPRPEKCLTSMPKSIQTRCASISDRNNGHIKRYVSKFMNEYGNHT